MSKYQRQIFYISRFDPRGADYYYKLYKHEAEKYASLTRRDKPVISAKNTAAPHRVDWRVETDESVTDYAFMCWKDLIRTKWKRNRYDFLKDTVATYLSYLSKARIITAARISHAPLILFFYPAILVIAAFLVSLIAAVVGGWVYWLLFPALMVGLFFIFRTWQPTWLLHTFSFNMDLCKNNRRDLEERCAAFADDIIKTVKDERHDEIILVGHSNGVSLVLKTLDKMARNNAVRSPKLKILTLGQFVQMVTLHREGKAMHDILANLQSLDNTWLDISAAADPACFPLVGPFYKSTTQSPSNITIASARLHTLYDDDTYKKLRGDKFNFHFLYLKCSDVVGAYNYPAITMNRESLETHIGNIVGQDKPANA